MADGVETGDSRVDEVLTALHQGRSAPLAEQVTAFESAHRVLQEVLTAADEL